MLNKQQSTWKAEKSKHLPFDDELEIPECRYWKPVVKYFLKNAFNNYHDHDQL